MIYNVWQRAMMTLVVCSLLLVPMVACACIRASHPGRPAVSTCP